MGLFFAVVLCHSRVIVLEPERYLKGSFSLGVATSTSFLDRS